MIKKLALMLLTLTVLTGCAGMDKSQCVTADWRTVGFEDGAGGKPETAIAAYRQDCAEHGVTPDLDAYRLGHLEGAQRFCTTRNGFDVGKRGGSYQNSCPVELEGQFLAGHADGKALYQAQRELSSARAAVETQQRLISTLEQDISVKTDLLVEDGLNRDERVALLTDIETLKQQLLDAVKHLPKLQRELRDGEHRFTRMQQRFTHYQ